MVDINIRSWHTQVEVMFEDGTKEYYTVESYFRKFTDFPFHRARGFSPQKLSDSVIRVDKEKLIESTVDMLTKKI